MDTPFGYTNPPWPEGHQVQFHEYHHRRPMNVGVIAGDLWTAHSR